MASYDEKCQSSEVEDELRRLRVFDLHCDTLDSLCMRDVEPFATQLSNTVGGDMVENDLALAAGRMAKAVPGGLDAMLCRVGAGRPLAHAVRAAGVLAPCEGLQIGRASCRERVCQYV